LLACCRASAESPPAARDFTDWSLALGPPACLEACGASDWACRAEIIACEGRAAGEDLAAAAVAAAIRQAAAILESRSGPMPAAVRSALHSYFDPELLDRARFSVGFPEGLSILGLQHHLQSASAMTFGDDIVFADERAAADPCLWAHELEHVKQYARLGIDAFARRFALASPTLEQPAYDQQAYVCGLLGG
jgi:hypothetical protein